MSDMNITTDQVRTLLSLVEKQQREYDKATIHPFSGVLTVSKGRASVLIRPNGVIGYDSRGNPTPQREL